MKNIFTRFISFALVIAIMTSTLANLTVVLNYEVNKDYIASYLCVNKSKPKMHCNGKCYMLKKMKQQEEQEKAPAGNSSVEKVQLQLFSENYFAVEFLNAQKDFQYPSFNPFFIPGNYCLSVFHPPTV